MFCANCGSRLPDIDIRFCPKCGMLIPVAAVSQDEPIPASAPEENHDQTPAEEMEILDEPVIAVSTEVLAAKNGFDPENFDDFLKTSPKYHYDSVSKMLSEEDASAAVDEYRERLKIIYKQKLEQFKQANAVANTQTVEKKAESTLSRPPVKVNSQETAKHFVPDDKIISKLNAMENHLRDIRKYTHFFYVLTIIWLIISIFFGIIMAIKLA